MILSFFCHDGKEFFYNNSKLTTGVMETTNIRRCGYPVRLPFQKFIEMYQVVYETAVMPIPEINHLML